MPELSVARAKKRVRKAIRRVEPALSDQQAAAIVNALLEDGLVVGEFEPCDECGAWMAYPEGHADWHRRSHELRLGSR